MLRAVWKRIKNMTKNRRRVTKGKGQTQEGKGNTRVCVCQVASVVSDSVTLWTVPCQVPLSTGFSRQESRVRIRIK